MDSVELARQTAAELHAQAVERGIEPWDPYAFVLAEVKHRGIDVESASPGAAVLNGGRAWFDPTERLIVHENTGTAFEQAFLVAHELGHVVLGDDQSVPTTAIDPTRSAEASPVGIDRVVDYGPRQRREVQVDLFAREFLMPRAFVRKLHLASSMTASQIAKRLNAPFDVVAQQLLDALLLPAVAPAVVADPKTYPPNEGQQAAIIHRGKPYLLEAGPGTGKTQTLAARVESLLESCDPRRILVLTFSNKAAREMAERIAAKRPQDAAAMWIGTFHAFGLDVIRRFHAELGLPKDPRMMDRTEAVELLEEEFTRLGLKHYRNLYDPTQIISDILQAISRAKDEVVDDARYAELAAAMRIAATTPEALEVAERASEVAKVFKRYEEIKKGLHRVDFGDLVSLPVRLLEARPEIRQHFQQLYDHVLVDEYQDVNRSSVRLLSLLRPSGENLWVVGDARQSIYRFRGASSFNVARFKTEDFAGADSGRLTLNYRSHQEVVDAFTTFATAMKVSRGDSALTAYRGASGRHPEYRAVVSAPQQSVALAEAITEMLAAGHAYRDQAVLCTGNERLSGLGQDLERLGIPVLFLGSLFERDEVKDMLALLSIIVDRRAMGLVRIANLSDFAMALGDVAAVFGHLRENESEPLSWLGKLDDIAGLPAETRASLARLGNALAGFPDTANPWTVLTTVLLDRTRIAASLAQSANVIDRTRAIALWQFLNFVRVQPPAKGLPIRRLLDRVRRLVRLGDERDLRQLPAAAQGIDAVRLMTVHGAKGLEFPVVHLPGMNADTLPRRAPKPPCPPPDGMIEGASGTADDILQLAQAEEQECLFYVALSRARDRLFLYSPTQKSDGRSRPATPFLERLGAGLARSKVTPTRDCPPAADEIQIVLKIDGSLRFTGAQIALYQSCARRFFYTHVLQIGGRRTTTAFMQMHDAVRTVFGEVIRDGDAFADDAEIRRKVAAACDAQGLATHGYATDFHTFGTEMIKYFVKSRDGATVEAPTNLMIMLGGEEIIVRPDEILVRAGGQRTLRQVKTGHRRADETDDVGAAAFLLAARKFFPGADVHLVHLSDQEAVPIEFGAKPLKNREDKLAGFLGNIRAGQFPTDPSPRRCPNCPAFFVCAAVPTGILKKKF